MGNRTKPRYDKFVVFPITRIIGKDLFIAYRKIEVEVDGILRTVVTHRRNILHSKFASYFAAPVYEETDDNLTVEVWLNNQEKQVWIVKKESHHTICNLIPQNSVGI